MLFELQEIFALARAKDCDKLLADFDRLRHKYRNYLEPVNNTK